MALIGFVDFFANSTDTKSYEVKHFGLVDFKVNSEFIDFVELIELVDFLANSTDTKSYE